MVADLVRRGTCNAATNEAGEDGGAESGGIRIDEQPLIPRQRAREFHHRLQHKDILNIMRDLLSDELHKVRHELLQTFVILNAGKRCNTESHNVFIGVGGQDCGLDFIKI